MEVDISMEAPVDLFIVHNFDSLLPLKLFNLKCYHQQQDIIPVIKWIDTIPEGWSAETCEDAASCPSWAQQGTLPFPDLVVKDFLKKHHTNAIDIHEIIKDSETGKPVNIISTSKNLLNCINTIYLKAHPKANVKYYYILPYVSGNKYTLNLQMIASEDGGELLRVNPLDNDYVDLARYNSIPPTAPPTRNSLYENSFVQIRAFNNLDKNIQTLRSLTHMHNMETPYYDIRLDKPLDGDFVVDLHRHIDILSIPFKPSDILFRIPNFMTDALATSIIKSTNENFNAKITQNALISSITVLPRNKDDKETHILIYKYLATDASSSPEKNLLFLVNNALFLQYIVSERTTVKANRIHSHLNCFIILFAKYILTKPAAEATNIKTINKYFDILVSNPSENYIVNDIIDKFITINTSYHLNQLQDQDPPHNQFIWMPDTIDNALVAITKSSSERDMSINVCAISKADANFAAAAAAARARARNPAPPPQPAYGQAAPVSVAMDQGAEGANVGSR